MVPQQHLWARRGSLVLEHGVVSDGVVVIDGAIVSYVGTWSDALSNPELRPVVQSLAAAPHHFLLPGLIDLHAHGGGGYGFDTADSSESARAIVDTHVRQGTTAMMASLVTASPGDMMAQAALAAELVGMGEVVGVHAEGPFLSARRRGAQDKRWLREGDVGFVDDLMAAAHGQLSVMTVAPELSGLLGSDGVVSRLLERGVIPSIGHSNATAGQTQEFLEWAQHAGWASATRPITATHLFNGMPTWHHRDPGPVPVLLAAAAEGFVVVELIADGIHLSDDTVRAVFSLLGADAIALVSDSIALAGQGDGQFYLGSALVRVSDSVARLVPETDPPTVRDQPGATRVDPGGGGGSLAGSTSFLLSMVRRAVVAGIPVVDAVRSASSVPARVLGLVDRGALARGNRADVLVCDEKLQLREVIRGGDSVSLT